MKKTIKALEFQKVRGDLKFWLEKWLDNFFRGDLKFWLEKWLDNFLGGSEGVSEKARKSLMEYEGFYGSEFSYKGGPYPNFTKLGENRRKIRKNLSKKDYNFFTVAT